MAASFPECNVNERATESLATGYSTVPAPLNEDRFKYNLARRPDSDRRGGQLGNSEIPRL